MLVTVFTPTYNRAYRIQALYESLQKQTCKDFEWLVVDDGSTDNTSELFEQWQSEKNSFPIRYFKQPNGGKHRAVNFGAKIADGQVFYIVDSDDQLPANSIEIIVEEYTKIKDNKEVGGLSGIKAYFDWQKVGGEQNFGTLFCNSLDFRYKYKIKGDMAEVFKTDVIREYPFPEIEGEKFCPEAVLFQRVAAKYKFYYFYKKIYLCDYLPDGLTARITKIRMQCPIASTICYSELVASKVPLFQKIRASINYWRFGFCHSDKIKPTVSPIWYFTYPIGLFMHINDKRTQK